MSYHPESLDDSDINTTKSADLQPSAPAIRSQTFSKCMYKKHIQPKITLKPQSI